MIRLIITIVITGFIMAKATEAFMNPHTKMDDDYNHKGDVGF